MEVDTLLIEFYVMGCFVVILETPIGSLYLDISEEIEEDMV